ncbi:MAG: NADH-quinone oxidoreductase subunit A [Caldilineales bacterium]
MILRQLKLFGLIEMGIFLLILLVGFAYAWRKDALEW